MTKLFTLFSLVILISGINKNYSQSLSEEKISARVDSVLSLMTIDEKIGQLNQLSYGSGWGPTVKVEISSQYNEMIKQGKIGSFLNATGADLTFVLQKI